MRIIYNNFVHISIGKIETFKMDTNFIRAVIDWKDMTYKLDCSVGLVF